MRTGDLVACVVKGHYSVTRPGVVCKVMACNGCNICVEVILSDNFDEIGRSFTVRSALFKTLKEILNENS